jgi:putative FmdB family regulatory protein
MPIYEYRCANCRRKVSIFWRSFSAVDESKARCSFCGSAHLSRLASRVRVIRSGAGRTDTAVPDAGMGGDMGDSFMNELEGLDENDPRQLGRMMRKMATETGEDMGPEFDEIVGRLEKGEDPEKIEQSMGDLFGDAPGGEGAGMGMMDDDMAPPAAPAGEGESEGKSAVKDKPGKASNRAVRVRKTPASASKVKKSKSTSKRGKA